MIKDGLVVNIVEVAADWPDCADPINRWTPPAGHIAVANDQAGKGWDHDPGKPAALAFSPPADPAKAAARVAEAIRQERAEARATRPR